MNYNSIKDVKFEDIVKFHAEFEHGWLMDTCLDGQDTFKRLLEMLDVL